MPAEARPRELELQVVVSYLTWVLGTELRSSTRAIHVLNLSVVSALTEVSIGVMLWLKYG